MQRYTVHLYPETALHVSDGTSTHHQEGIQLYLQHLVFVTPLLLSAAIVKELEPVWVCCGWRTPLYRRLGGTQGRFGRMRKISPPPGFDPPDRQLIASRYTDWAITDHSQQDVKSQNDLILNAAARTSKPLKILAFIYIMLLYTVQSRALQFSGCNSCFVYSCWVRTWAQRPGHCKAFRSLLPHLQALLLPLLTEF
jgi:hypothetical protein